MKFWFHDLFNLSNYSVSKCSGLSLSSRRIDLNSRGPIDKPKISFFTSITFLLLLTSVLSFMFKTSANIDFITISVHHKNTHCHPKSMPAIR